MQESLGANKMAREIADVLLFREDFSPFLVHLTRGREGTTASNALSEIIGSRELRSGPSEVSDVKYGGFNSHFTPEQRREFFSAICFSETPISEVHCLLEVAGRSVNLEPYGLVFLKALLESRGVAPVVYLNNLSGSMDPVIQTLFNLHTAAPPAARLLLPLISSFGRKLTPPGWLAPPAGFVDWRWEREWRLPSTLAPLRFNEADVFIGLCPDDEIDAFEALLPGVAFIDPRRNMKWYATKLLEARHRLALKYSVV